MTVNDGSSGAANFTLGPLSAVTTGAGKLAVASDADGSIAASFDLMVREAPAAGFNDTRGVAIDHGFAERTTFIVGSDGKIVGTVGGQGVSPEDNVLQSLAMIESL